ncbi:carbamate kinase, partial [Enterococcus faecalis]
KDFASEKLAELVDADALVILTGVDYVFVNFGQANQQALTDVTVTVMQQYIEENQFAPGSMLPKVEAAISFAESKPNRQAIIGLLELASEAIKGESGTRITQ